MKAHAPTRAETCRVAWKNTVLRRIALAFALFRVAEFAAWLALTAESYRLGGIGESTIVLVCQLAPAAVVALSVGGLIRRWGPARVLQFGFAAQSLGLAIAAIGLAGGPPRLVGYLGAVLATLAITTTRPCQSVLQPAIVADPDELTAGNVLLGWINGAAAFVGPMIAAALMIAIGAWSVFALMAIGLGGATWLVAPIPVGAAASAAADDVSVLDGLQLVSHSRGPRLLIVGLSIHALLIGALDLLVVVIAVEVLDRTEAFGGWLAAALGIGGVIAGVLAVVTIGRKRLAPGITGVALLAGGALALVSVPANGAVAIIALMVVCGGAASLYDVMSRMLLQRVTRLDLLGHTFAALEAIQMAMLGVGVITVPILVTLIGAEAASAAVGTLFAITAILLAPGLDSIDRGARVPITEMALLRSTRLFGPLPGPALESLAREARRIDVVSGDVVITEGQHGEFYFAVIDGQFSVTSGDRQVNQIERGGGFGEIALLHDVRRNASVTATTDGMLLAIDRETFLLAVAGHAPTMDIARHIAVERGAADRGAAE